MRFRNKTSKVARKFKSKRSRFYVTRARSVALATTLVLSAIFFPLISVFPRGTNELQRASSFISCTSMVEHVHVVTSMASALFRSENLKNTILEHSRWRDTNFVIFNEESWERQHGRDGAFRMNETKWRKAKKDQRTCTVDIFQAEPWLGEALKTGGSIDEFYDYAGFMEPCDQPLRFKSGKLLVRKLAAMLHMLNSVQHGDIVIWLDTDVSFTTTKLDNRFLNFVKQRDVTMIPFSTNKQWGDVAVPDFDNDLSSPYWRIESGVVVFVANPTTRRLMEYVKYLYTGGLLSIAKQCIALRANDEFCQQIWVRRNLYMDDIFAFTLALRYFREYRGLEIGWFYSGCGAHCASCQHRLRAGSKDLYAFPHVCTGPDYVTTFDLTRYVFHRVGSGYYSQMFRESFRDRPLHERSWRYVDAELEFSDKQKFNNTLEFRFLGENSTTLKDELWSCRTLKLRRDAQLWPADQPLTYAREPTTPNIVEKCV